MSQELKPCPFCGRHLTELPFGVVRCTTDGCVIEHFSFDTEWPEKVEAWNTRASLWQPIETAPRDGEPVMIWKPSERMVGEYMMAAYWDENHFSGNAGWVPVGGVHVQGYHSSVTDTPQGHPTKWQHLPTPPQEPDNAE
jgi:hypothetical protein